MDNTSDFARQLLASAPELLATGYIEELTAEALADYGLESQFAALDADEPGSANSWSPAECASFFDNLKAQLTSLGLP